MGLKLNCDNINEEDKALAINVRNYLAAGKRVIGQPGESLKQTLSELEKKLENKDKDFLDWDMDDAELISKIAMTKAGIEGETKLCEYLAKLLKYDDNLEGIVAFASLCYQPEENTKDYTPDTDTLLIYGQHALIIDAKNLKTKANATYKLLDGAVVDDRDKPLIEVHPSTHIWKKVIGENLLSIDGYVCIVNKTLIDIDRNEEWYNSNTKLIHISELHDILLDWVKDKDNKLYLNILTKIAKTQVKKERKTTLDIESIKRQFGV